MWLPSEVRYEAGLFQDFLSFAVADADIDISFGGILNPAALKVEIADIVRTVPRLSSPPKLDQFMELIDKAPENVE